MKRLLVLFLLPASLAFAEDATLSANTVLRTDKSLVILKAGTVVHVLRRNEKTIAVKVGNTTGLIPFSAIEDSDESMMMEAGPVRRSAPKPVSTPAPAAASTPPPPAPTPAAPRPAQTMYGKAVEKARQAAGSHEKNLVDPADEAAASK